MPINELKTKAKDPTHAVFGVDLEGAPYSYCISAGPHWLLCGTTGCTSPEDKVIMADGCVKEARDVSLGDSLMGMDGNPRVVLDVHQGRGEMYRLSPEGWPSCLVNSEHILSVIEQGSTEVVDFPLDLFIGLNVAERNKFRVFRSVGYAEQGGGCSFKVGPDGRKRLAGDYETAPFTIEKESDDGEYRGFAVEDDEMYMLEGGLVVHNSGKSVAANALLISMIYHSTPNELRITWIDPKKVEATAYIGLPYCPVDPVTDMGDAYGLMCYMVWEMKRRYIALGKAGVKNISEYNEWYDNGHAKESAALGYENRMPYWIVMIDEYANVATEAKETEDMIKTLAAMSRASGQHIILSTQRPSVDVISGTLKSNLPSKIALSVSSTMNSMIILDHEGAEKLLGHGDSIIAPNGKDEARVQFPYISNEEIDRIFEHLTNDYVKPRLTEFEKRFDCGDGRVNYKAIVTDAELCREMEFREPMCDWFEGASPEDTDDPKKQHVKMHRRSFR